MEQKEISVFAQDHNINVIKLYTPIGGVDYGINLSQNIEIQSVAIEGKKILSADGINANAQRIQNVATGVAPTDAVNRGQLEHVGELLRAEITSNSQSGKPQRINPQLMHYQGIRAFFDLGDKEVISVVNCISWEVDYNNNQLIIHGYSSENTKIIGVNYKIN